MVVHCRVTPQEKSGRGHPAPSHASRQVHLSAAMRTASSQQRTSADSTRTAIFTSPAASARSVLTISAAPDSVGSARYTHSIAEHAPMRLAQPRIAPLRDDEFTPQQLERLEKARQKDGSVLNIFRTLVRVPDAFRAFNWWGGYVLSRNSLSARDREIVILRTGWLC